MCPGEGSAPRLSPGHPEQGVWARTAPCAHAGTSHFPEWSPQAGRSGVSARCDPFCFANRKLPRGGKANSVLLGSAVSLAEINVRRGTAAGSPGCVGGAGWGGTGAGRGPPSTPESWGRRARAAGWGTRSLCSPVPPHSLSSMTQLTPPPPPQLGRLRGSLSGSPLPSEVGLAREPPKLGLDQCHTPARRKPDRGWPPHPRPIGP